MYWILDNGHGGMIDGVYQTAGKRSPVWPDGRQLFEGVFNRTVVNLISEELQDINIDHEIMVTEEEDISLVERVRMINRISKIRTDAVLLSIHGNAGGGTGWEVWTSAGETRSDKIASVFYVKAKLTFPNMVMRADFTDKDPDKENQFYILRKTICPAILTENFFMDTLYPDCDIMMSNEGQKQIASLHVEAIKHIEKW